MARYVLTVLLLVGLAIRRVVSGAPSEHSLSSRKLVLLDDNQPSGKPAGEATSDNSTADAAAFSSQSGDCKVPYIFRPEAPGSRKGALQPGEKPNFIIIITDDQGWDDIGLHNPNYVNTPHLDRFIQRGMLFDNFYTSPQCSQSRAKFLTGRHAAKVGTMLVHGGWDFINSGEATAGEVMLQLGYHTAHYGKWHNGRTLGYEPWTVGFQDSWFPTTEIENSLVNHNGVYVQSSKWVDDVLMDKVLGFLDARAEDKHPFFTFYAPHAIHTSRTEGPFKGKAYRSYPQEWREKYDNDTKYDGIASATKDAWAMLEWLDSILGRLFDYLDNSPLGNNTYVMIMGDNGPQLLKGEQSSAAKQLRMPSNMEGRKSFPYEGGIRNFLAAQGPGVPAGAVDSALLGLADILPTMVDLAGSADLASNSTEEALHARAAASDQLPFDGVSFSNLLLSGKSKPTPAERGTQYANQQQAERFLFTLVPHCWSPDAVPVLNGSREVDRSQTLFDYDHGGMPHYVYGNEIPGMTAHPGFQLCIAVRHKQYKWIGFQPDKVYTVYPSHIERNCTELPPAQAAPLAAKMAAAAREWWQTVVASPFSFTKPVFYLGLMNFTVTNILADGAHERTEGAVRLTVNGARGFKVPGDRMCFGVKVETSGTYSVTLFYASKIPTMFKWAVGPYADIMAGTAPAIVAQLPAEASTMSGKTIGSLLLTSSEGAKWDACLELVSQGLDADAFTNLFNIRMILKSAAVRQTLDVSMLTERAQNIPAQEAAGAAAITAAAAPDIDVLGQYKWLNAAMHKEPYKYSNVHSLLRHKYRWPRGQTKLESMFSPYDAEDMDWCAECKPRV